MAALRTTLITGASSGIGRAIALACALPGAALHLSGRNGARLDAVAAACRERGAIAETAVLDVRDAPLVANWVAGTGRLDLVIANAGISAGTGFGAPETAPQVRDLFATNLDGALNTMLPAMALMATQPAGADGVRGRIAAIASLAAFVASPVAPAYCASKAALDAWTVATAPIARRQGISLTSVCPGFVRTPMTDSNHFPMPGLMNADRAAQIILRGIETGRVRIAFPWWLALATKLTGVLPARLSGALLAGAPGKDAAAARGT